jgi:hypothetical protein
MEKYSCYEFEIKESRHRFCYFIYSEGCKPYFDGTIESDEWFESEQKARYAAIGHITLLENGES